MADRRWTVMVVPHGSDSPRSYSISERAVRPGCTSVPCRVDGGIGRYRDRDHRTLHHRRDPSDRSERDELAPARCRKWRSASHRCATLSRSSEKREAQIRLLAGLPATDSGRRSWPAAQDSLADSASRGLPHADVETLIQRADQLSARFAAVTDSLERNAQRFASVPSIMPTPGWLTSQFSRSRNHPLLHISRPHEGIDVAAPMGAPDRRAGVRRGHARSATRTGTATRSRSTTATASSLVMHTARVST